ncbi:hypothetical protein PWT90_09581 [Aphanocladium album]|nr:hypothetical protein PWT90_09581 [Aphanocladium album]
MNCKPTTASFSSSFSSSPSPSPTLTLAVSFPFLPLPCQTCLLHLPTSIPPDSLATRLHPVPTITVTHNLVTLPSQPGVSNATPSLHAGHPAASMPATALQQALTMLPPRSNWEAPHAAHARPRLPPLTRLTLPHTSVPLKPSFCAASTPLSLQSTLLSYVAAPSRTLKLTLPARIDPPPVTLCSLTRLAPVRPPVPGIGGHAFTHLRFPSTIAVRRRQRTSDSAHLFGRYGLGAYATDLFESRLSNARTAHFRGRCLVTSQKLVATGADKNPGQNFADRCAIEIRFSTCMPKLLTSGRQMQFYRSPNIAAVVQGTPLGRRAMATKLTNCSAIYFPRRAATICCRVLKSMLPRIHQDNSDVL